LWATMLLWARCLKFLPAMTRAQLADDACTCLQGSHQRQPWWSCNGASH